MLGCDEQEIKGKCFLIRSILFKNLYLFLRVSLNDKLYSVTSWF